MAWTGEPPNYLGSSHPKALHVHPFAQFNSAHPGGVTMFAFADGSVTALAAEIDFDVFYSLGTIRGREILDRQELK